MHSNSGSNQWKKIPNPCIPFRDEILKLYREGKTFSQIAELVQVSSKAVSQFFENEGIKKHKFWNTVCYRNRDLVLKMAADNRSLHEIGRAVGTNDRRVRQFLDYEGVKRDYPKNYGGTRSAQWKGGKTTSKGYVRILKPEHPHARNGYVLEHRLVMEENIGRILFPDEVVHHRNGVKNDNRIENLQLFSENRLHLAHELNGRCPKWTTDGWERMQTKAAQGRAALQAKRNRWLELGVHLWNKKKPRSLAGFRTILQTLLQTELPPEPALPVSLPLEQSDSRKATQ